MELIEIKEVIDKAVQGMSGPYKCRSFDNVFYFVKGRNTTPDSMYKEWVCGHLAQELGLPIADFSLVKIDSLLVNALPEDMQDIGEGIAFGSKGVEQALWFEQASAHRVSKSIQRSVVAFDWWIKNMDRSKGNPNLLLDSDKELVVIDHNNAFDIDFKADKFIDEHIFSEEAKQLFANYIEKAEWQKLFRNALPLFEQALSCAPDGWKWYDLEETVLGNFDAEYCRKTIELCKNTDFWEIK